MPGKGDLEEGAAEESVSGYVGADEGEAALEADGLPEEKNRV